MKQLYIAIDTSVVFLLVLLLTCVSEIIRNKAILYT